MIVINMQLEEYLRKLLVNVNRATNSINRAHHQDYLCEILQYALDHAGGLPDVLRRPDHQREADDGGKQTAGSRAEEERVAAYYGGDSEEGHGQADDADESVRCEVHSGVGASVGVDEPQCGGDRTVGVAGTGDDGPVPASPITAGAGQ